MSIQNAQPGECIVYALYLYTGVVILCESCSQLDAPGPLPSSFVSTTTRWNVVTHGEKRWAAVEPRCPADLVEAATPPEDTSWSILEWFTIEWPKVQIRCAERGFETFDWVQQKGETVYVPAGWWHAVLNLSSSIAITHNVLHTVDLSAIVRDAVSAGGVAGQGMAPREGAASASLLTDAVVRNVAAALELDLDVPRGLEGARTWLRELIVEGLILAEDATVVSRTLRAYVVPQVLGSPS